MAMDKRRGLLLRWPWKLHLRRWVRPRVGTWSTYSTNHQKLVLQTSAEINKDKSVPVPVPLRVGGWPPTSLPHLPILQLRRIVAEAGTRMYGGGSIVDPQLASGQSRTPFRPPVDSTTAATIPT
jgi:hypothetical protein